MIEQQLDETAEERRRRVNREKAREYRETHREQVLESYRL